MSEKLQVKTLRKVKCNDDWDCPGRHKVDGVPGSFVVLREVTDPQQRAALAHLVGPGELLGWTPDDLFDPYAQEV